MADDSVGFFFNVEKFLGSTAVRRMSCSEVGVYVLMLLQQWREKARSLPDDAKAVADVITVTEAQAAEVIAGWDVVRRKFVADRRAPGRIYNIELEKTRRQQRKYFRKRQAAGREGGKASAAKRQETKGLEVKQSLTVVERSSSDQKRVVERREDPIREEKHAASAVDARGKRPIYTSDRFAVHEWQLDELGKILGPHLDDFDLHAFFDGLSQQSRASGLVIPRAGVWEWLQAQVLAEARRRGLPIAGTATAGKQTTRLAAALASIKAAEG